MRLDELFLREDGRVVPGVNTTVDVGAGEIARQAAKFGFSVTEDGVPPVISKDSAIKAFRPAPPEPPHGAMSPLSHAGTPEWQRLARAEPGSEDWFKAWFSRPYLTGKVT